MQLKVLEMNDNTVNISKEDRKLKSLRMTGVLQSYDMFDGRVYHNAQIMKAIVANEKKELGEEKSFDESVRVPLVESKMNAIVPEELICSPKDVELTQTVDVKVAN